MSRTPTRVSLINNLLIVEILRKVRIEVSSGVKENTLSRSFDAGVEPLHE